MATVKEIKEVSPMKKQVYEMSLPYSFDPTHKGAPYTFDNGAHWCNHGDFIEIMVKYHLGFAPAKDGNGSYDKTSDIAEIRASVKSSKATLVNKKLGANIDETLHTYFATTHSTQFFFGHDIDGQLHIYMMDAPEFDAFCRQFATYDKGRQVVRFKTCSGKMISWLEAHI